MYSVVFSYKLDNYWGGIDEYKREKIQQKEASAVNIFVHFAWLIFCGSEGQEENKTFY